MPIADDDHQTSPGKSWTTNQCYILAALGGTLAVAAVITITSLILSPGQITFSVDRASRHTLPDGSTSLAVSIAAHNPSRRCRTRYQSVFVDFKNSSTAAGKFWIHANVPSKVFPMEYKRGPNVTLINASIIMVGDSNDLLGYVRRANNSGLIVVVTALVRFKIGVTPTRLYEIKVFCPGVVFADGDKSNSSAHRRSFNCNG